MRITDLQIFLNWNGSTKDADTNGLVMLAEINTNNVTLRTIRTRSGSVDGQYNGTYPTYGTSVHGRDGKTYLEYKGENSDYQDVIMVDSVLLNPGTTGLLQIRARGEGFFNSVFVCREARN